MSEAADAPEVSADIKQNDDGLSQISALIYYLLIDKKKSEVRNENILLITNLQRSELTKEIAKEFGKKFSSSNTSAYVNAASALDLLLRKQFKAADEN
jgi:hypothetical protein